MLFVHRTRLYTWKVIFLTSLFWCCNGLFLTSDTATNKAQDLLDYLFHGNNKTRSAYNKWIRPVDDPKHFVDVTLQLIVRQLLDVDEKNQLVNTNVWLKQSWTDVNLKWIPTSFGNVTSIRVPSEWIWVPDIVLIANTDGNFSVSHMTRALLHYDGKVTWEPPATFKSWCKIDVTYFPFDIQNCSMIFASWSYTNAQVKLRATDDKVDITKLLENGEWEIVDTSITFIDQEDHNESLVPHYEEIVHASLGAHGLSYSFILRRLPLFYTVFLITPCLGISFLTALVFYLPSESQEKITLCISILLAHTFYLLVITEIIPSTSNAIPAIGEYLLFTMIFIALSIIITTISINMHYRNNSTYRPLPKFVRVFLLHFAPKYLCIQKFPTYKLSTESSYQLNMRSRQRQVTKMKKKGISKANQRSLIALLRCIQILSRRVKRQIQQKKEADEWKYAAMVMDRIFFLVFIFISSVGTILVFLPAWARYHKY